MAVCEHLGIQVENKLTTECGVTAIETAVLILLLLFSTIAMQQLGLSTKGVLQTASQNVLQDTHVTPQAPQSPRSGENTTVVNLNLVNGDVYTGNSEQVAEGKGGAANSLYGAPGGIDNPSNGGGTVSNNDFAIGKPRDDGDGESGGEQSGGANGSGGSGDGDGEPDPLDGNWMSPN